MKIVTVIDIRKLVVNGNEVVRPQYAAIEGMKLTFKTELKEFSAQMNAYCFRQYEKDTWGLWVSLQNAAHSTIS